MYFLSLPPSILTSLLFSFFVCTHTHEHRGQRLTLATFLCCSPPLILRQELSLSSKLSDSAVLTDQSLQGPPTSPTPALGLQSSHCAQLLHGCLVPDLGLPVDATGTSLVESAPQRPLLDFSHQSIYGETRMVRACCLSSLFSIWGYILQVSQLGSHPLASLVGQGTDHAQGARLTQARSQGYNPNLSTVMIPN